MAHIHGDDCGHLKIKHGDHVDFLVADVLQNVGSNKVEAHTLEVSEQNPDGCHSLVCFHRHEGTDPLIPHGDHKDYLHHGHLHHVHGDHCDDHGPVDVL